MNIVQAAASAVVTGSPEKLYAALTDFGHARPSILPRPYFTDFAVEAGGCGPGTIYRLRLRVLGAERSFQRIVTSPVPGRVLVETDLNTGHSTIFQVAPYGDNGQSRVSIATAFDPRPAGAGILDRLVNPLLTRRILRRELDLLAEWLAAEMIWETELEAGLRDGRTIWPAKMSCPDSFTPQERGFVPVPSSEQTCRPAQSAADLCD